MTEFTPPKAVVLYGEGLDGMSLGAYEFFLKQLGAAGLNVGLPNPKTVGRELGLDKEVSTWDPFLIDQDAFRTYAHKLGLSRPVRVWSFLQKTGLYAPGTPRALRVTQQKAHKHALFYYPLPALTTEVIARGHGAGIDFEQGTTYADRPHPRLGNALLDLQAQARLDGYGLLALVSRGNFVDEHAVSPEIARFLGGLYNEITKPS